MSTSKTTSTNPQNTAFCGCFSAQNPSFTFSAKERDVETGLSYFGSRYYSSDLSIWLSVDPMAAKYPGLSPYVYCANNPIKLVDPNGEEVDWEETKYYNSKGELLFETNDGLDDKIIVEDANLLKFEQKLKETNENGTIDDPVTNKRELHTLGVNIKDYKSIKCYNSETEDFNWQAGYNGGYKDAFNGKNTWFKNIFYSFLGGLEQGDNGEAAGCGTMCQIGAGYAKGRMDGEYDRKNAKINRLHPDGSLKHNKPLINL